jgi:hypothetical protein
VRIKKELSLVQSLRGAFLSISFSFSLATVSPPESRDFDFSYVAEGVTAAAAEADVFVNQWIA